MTRFHGFYLRGMFGKFGSDPGATVMTKRMAQIGIAMHGSPYEDYDAGKIAFTINGLSEEDGVFVCGTSLGACDVPVVCNYVTRYKTGRSRIDGAFGFQASYWGAKGFLLNDNVKFAHLIYSYMPIPFPLIGAYKWPRGTMEEKNFRLTPHHLIHPGDYDANDQNTFLWEMQKIMIGSKP